MTSQKSSNSHDIKDSKRVLDADVSSANQANKKQRCDYTIGIDLGTTNSCLAIHKENKCTVIKNIEGYYTTPSYVSYSETEEVIVGKVALNLSHRNRKTTIYDAKRLIGRKFDEQVKKESKRWPFEVVDFESKAAIKLNFSNNESKFLMPEEVSADVLRYLKKLADAYLGLKSSNAVITIPANFDTNQREATMKAGALAGFEKVTLLNEPTAAAIAHCFQHKNKENDRNILVFDLGGGTFDVSIVNCIENVYTVQASNGDPNLGGQHFKDLIYEHCIKYLSKNYSQDIGNNPDTLNNLCEEAKCSLSSCLSYNIELSVKDNYYTIPITRKEFENLSEDLFKRIIKIVEDCLKLAQMKKTKIDEVVLVGGSTSIPKIREIVQQYFNHLTIKFDTDPDQSIAVGAAIKGVTQELILIDVLSLSIGVETSGSLMTPILPRNTPLPACKKKVFSVEQSLNSLATCNVSINVYQGERLLTKDNVLLGSFRLENVNGNSDSPSIEITVEIDTNGICEISAKDTTRDVQGNITLKNLIQSSNEIKELTEKAKENLNHDMEEKKLIEEKLNIKEKLRIRILSLGISEVQSIYTGFIDSIDNCTRIEQLNSEYSAIINKLACLENQSNVIDID